MELCVIEGGHFFVVGIMEQLRQLRIMDTAMDGHGGKEDKDNERDMAFINEEEMREPADAPSHPKGETDDANKDHPEEEGAMVLEEMVSVFVHGRASRGRGRG